jgi:BTB/POZ domain
MKVSIVCGSEVFVVQSERLRPDLSPVFQTVLDSDHDGEIHIDRDPRLFKGILAYLQTGVITASDISQDFYREADFWGISPECPHVLADIRIRLNSQAILYDILLFLERLLSTNTFNPVTSYVLPCKDYAWNDRWSKDVDAFKYIMYPDELRTIAFCKYGVEIVNTEIFEAEIESLYEGNQQITKTVKTHETVYTKAIWSKMTGEEGTQLPCISGILDQDEDSKCELLCLDYNGLSIVFKNTLKHHQYRETDRPRRLTVNIENGETVELLR